MGQPSQQQQPQTWINIINKCPKNFWCTSKHPSLHTAFYPATDKQSFLRNLVQLYNFRSYQNAKLPNIIIYQLNILHIETSTFSQRVLFYFADRQTTFYESLSNSSIMDHTKVLNFSIDIIWKVQQYPNCTLVWSNFSNSISCFSMVSIVPQPSV